MTDLRSDRAIALLVLAAWAALATYRGWNQWGIDLSALYFAAHYYGTGDLSLIYADGTVTTTYGVPADWLALADSLGLEGRHLSRYLYPPLWAALLAPLAARVDIGAFLNGFLVLHVAVLVACPLLAYRLVRPAAVSLTLWAALSVLAYESTAAVRLALELNQPQILVAGLTLAAFACVASRRPISGGMLLGLAAAIKLTPIVLALVFVMERNWRALAATCATALALAGLSLALTGGALHRAMLDLLSAMEGEIIVSGLNYSVGAVIWQLGEAAAGTADWSVARQIAIARPDWVGLAGSALLVAGLAAAYLATRRTAAPHRLWLRLMLVSLTVILCSPIAWVHYLVLPVCLLPGVLSLLAHRTAVLTMAAVLAAMSATLWQELLIQTGTLWSAIFAGTATTVLVYGLFLTLSLTTRARATAGPAAALRPDGAT